ncbi:MAG TPA: SGNH/GDSL hydrolase family protein, partial [Polyangiaceae bacterium]
GGGSAVAGAPVARSGGPGTGGSALSNVAGERSGGSGGVTVAGAGTPGAGMPGAGMPGAGSNMGGTASGAAAGAAGSHAAASGSGGSSSLPPHSGTWRITPLGDSITGSTCGPQLLAKALADHGKTNFVFVGSNLNNQSCNGAGTVQTEGHGGYLVTDLVGNGMHAAELPKWCESNRADLVLMQFGTNDVWSDHSPSVILDAYSTVLSDLRAANPNVVVMVAQITPLNPKDCADCEARVVALNAQIPAWASSKTSAASPVSVVDLHAAFVAASYTLNSTYTADGVHPNVAGAQLIAAKWFDALVALGAP